MRNPQYFGTPRNTSGPVRLFSRGVVAAFGAFGVAAGAHAEVRLPHTLGDHMVLQRDAPIHVWGWADPGETVHVSLDKDSGQATADTLGLWSVFLQPYAAGGPYALQVQRDSNTVTLQDVMLGDLWIASGQSNMEMPLAGFTNLPVKDGEKTIAAANSPDIRFLLLPKRGSETPQTDVNAAWTRCTPETAKNFSAVAYFFGREIQQKEHVAIGLIDTTWGGTPADTWTSLDMFGRNPLLTPAWATWNRFMERRSTLDETLAVEKREDDAAVAAGKPKPQHPWHQPVEAYRPASLYNGMIAPLTPLSMRGVIWYQGETNSGLDRAPLYHELFSSMIRDWRTHFAQGPFPFLFVQISSFTSSPGEAWGVLRDAQRRTLSLEKTAMAVTLDVGVPGNVHPPDKATVGHRLALAARALSYGEPVHYAGPLFARADVEGGSVRVGFEDRMTKLECRGGKCAGFEVAGDDHVFHPADASVEGVSVLVRSASVAKPVYVRYAWPNAPEANLFDETGLPASTFTSEESVVEFAPRVTARQVAP